MISVYSCVMCGQLAVVVNEIFAIKKLYTATTWMGDCLWTGKPSQYVTDHQGQLSLSSLDGW